MPQRPFRFLHAADLHLERACQTAAEVPEHLADLFIESPQRAAAKVFDAAIDQHVDFVVLAGDVINPNACAPRELLFLVEQFQRLSDKNIPVYWSGGTVDLLQHWPSYVSWSKNVYRFASNSTDRQRYEVGGSCVCEIVGRSHDALQAFQPYQFAPSTQDVFSIAVAHAEWNASALGEIGINYWALGGPHQRSTPLETSHIAHFGGSPQGRCPSEIGPHGCTIVTVDENRRIQLALINCDVLRWLRPQLSMPEAAIAADLERQLQERTEQLRAESPGIVLLITWQVSCQDPLRWALRHGTLATELLTKLRQDFGRRSSPVWTLGVEAELPDQLPAPWYAEETLRGDFLRAVQQSVPEFSLAATQTLVDRNLAVIHSNGAPQQPLVLPLPDSALQWSALGKLSPAETEALAAFSPLGATDTRQILREVAWLGADLLSPAEAER